MNHTYKVVPKLILSVFVIKNFFQSILAGNDTHMINATQRVALRNANSTSFGYFVTTDSSFGNQILPVLPRIDSE